MSEERGLYGKYRIYHEDGLPADPEGMYFVLKLNAKDPKVAHAARQAILTYANRIESFQLELAANIRMLVKDLNELDPN